ncbi:MAG: ABC transporter substrate-binding protein [Myxococcota bacterium]
MLILAIAGCSLGTTDWAACTEPAQCRDAFGLGWTCGGEGLCAEVGVHRRCGETFPEDLLLRPENYPDAIVVGALFDHTSDIPETQAARLAVKQANDSGGLDGRPFGLVQCTYEEDSTLDALAMDEATTETALWLAHELGVHAIVGPATSGMTEAAWNAVGDATLIVSPSATSPALTYIDGIEKTDEEPGLLWRTAPPDSLQGQVLAQDVAAQLGEGSHEVAVIHEVGPYGEGLADVFLTESSGNDAVTLYTFENDTQRDTAVNDVSAQGPDAVVFISSELSDVASFLNAAVELDYAGMPIWLADAAHDTELLAQTQAARETLWPNIRGTAPAVPSGDIYEFFASSYRSEYDGDDAAASSYTAYAYDAAWLTLYGAAWADANEGGISGLGAARGLRHVSAGTEIEVKPLNWGEVQANFDAGEDVDLVGASGALDYDPETGETSGPVDVWVIDSLEFDFVTVDTIEP